MNNIIGEKERIVLEEKKIIREETSKNQMDKTEGSLKFANNRSQLKDHEDHYREWTRRVS